MPAPTPPPIGSATPGDLYVDLQSRALWLGVDAAVNPAEAVLISDHLYELELIAAAEAAANVYTDDQIAGRAPLSHTHPSSQITDFEAAVETVVAGVPGFNWVPGMIMMWAGSLAEIGAGGLAGWALCDGSNGTPDLRDRFILGAGNRVPGSKNAVSSVATSAAGNHTHTVGGTAINTNQMPSHSHGGFTGVQTADHAHYVNLNSGYVSAGHSHNITAYDGSGDGARQLRHDDSDGSGAMNFATGGVNTNHYHNVQGYSGGISANHSHSIPAQGGSQTHTHTLTNAADHTHSVTTSNVRDVAPFYALAFIMKL